MHVPKMVVTAIAATALAIGLSACSAEESANNAATSDLAIDKSTCDTLAAKYPGLAGKTLTVGISPAPANYSASDPKNPSNIIGIEPDLLNAAGQCLGFRTTYSKLDFAGLVPALQSGRVDLVAAGMYSSEERVKQVDFVNYMKAGEASIVAAGNPKNIKSLADICGHGRAGGRHRRERDLRQAEQRVRVDGQASAEDAELPEHRPGAERSRAG